MSGGRGRGGDGGSRMRKAFRGWRTFRSKLECATVCCQALSYALIQSEEGSGSVRRPPVHQSKQIGERSTYQGGGLQAASRNKHKRKKEIVPDS